MSLKRLFIIVAILAATGMTSPVMASAEDSDLAAIARKLAQRLMIVDTHIDVPYRVIENWVDVTQRTEDGDFDYERARHGGLDIPFMSIYTPAESEEEGTSYALANQLIDSVEAMAGRAPGKFTIVRSAQDAEKAMERGLMGLAMGMENGSPIDGKLHNLEFFHDRGISYITLAHSKSNHISDSSYDEERQWNGLSLALSKAPLIASHSSARHFTPGFERNMSDEMIKALADKGGVIQINFGSSFLTREGREWFDVMGEARKLYLEENGFDEHGEEANNFRETFREDHPFPYATLDDVVANFQHVIGLVGVKHVGVGSDFDGVGDSLPEGMKDVSFYPQLIERLLRLEYSSEDIEAIMGGNLMRVWRQVEELASISSSG